MGAVFSNAHQAILFMFIINVLTILNVMRIEKQTKKHQTRKKITAA